MWMTEAHDFSPGYFQHVTKMAQVQTGRDHCGHSEVCEKRDCYGTGAGGQRSVGMDGKTSRGTETMSGDGQLSMRKLMTNCEGDRARNELEHFHHHRRRLMTTERLRVYLHWISWWTETRRKN